MEKIQGDAVTISCGNYLQVFSCHFSKMSASVATAGISLGAAASLSGIGAGAPHHSAKSLDSFFMSHLLTVTLYMQNKTDMALTWNK